MLTPLRVLIVEDSPSDAKLMVAELRHSGFDPEWHRVDTEADYLVHLVPAPDLILSDFSIPQFNALRALQHLREKKHFPVDTGQATSSQGQYPVASSPHVSRHLTPPALGGRLVSFAMFFKPLELINFVEVNAVKPGCLDL